MEAGVGARGGTGSSRMGPDRIFSHFPKASPRPGFVRVIVGNPVWLELGAGVGGMAGMGF